MVDESYSNNRLVSTIRELLTDNREEFKDKKTELYFENEDGTEKFGPFDDLDTCVENMEAYAVHLCSIGGTFEDVYPINLDTS